VNVASLFKAVDALMAFRDAAKRFKDGSPPPPETAQVPTSSQAQGLAGQIETRLTNVVVAALKEAFDRKAKAVDAFAAASFVIDELKTRAPIWKKEHWPGGAEWSQGS